MLMAFAALSDEAQLTNFGMSAGIPAGCLGKVLRDFHIGKILHLTALVADEMHMRGSIRVKPLYAIHRTQACDDALPLEQGQVPVYGSQ